MSSIRSQSIKKASRNRECKECGRTIKKGSDYVNQAIRYDGKIITYSFHTDKKCMPPSLVLKHEGNTCKDCDYPIAENEHYCGECAVEDDCGY